VTHASGPNANALGPAACVAAHTSANAITSKYQSLVMCSSQPPGCSDTIPTGGTCRVVGDRHSVIHAPQLANTTAAAVS
jgi:hypothetical protein